MDAEDFEHRAHREASAALVDWPIPLDSAEWNACHDRLTLLWMRAYRDGVAETVDDFRAAAESRSAL